MCQEVHDTIKSIPKCDFKCPKFKRRLIRKINIVCCRIQRGRYKFAKFKLKYDVLRKMDGCALRDRPDCNDWIKDCDSQSLIYPLIVEWIDLLEDVI
jgi:hypothetical protein